MKALRAAPPYVVAIGGFDPSCGAGVVADARSIGAMGAMPLAVVTSLTVQSGAGVRSSSNVSADLVRRQLAELLGHLPVRAIKIGQVPTAKVAAAVAAGIAGGRFPVVLDPVFSATGGGRLASDAAIDAIRRRLLPLATLVTANLAEASLLCSRRVTTVASMRRAAADLAALGARAVLVKGGHLAGDPVDVLLCDGTVRELRAVRIAASMHGTGCALASAAAARLAAGDSIDAAVRKARDHVRALLVAAQKRGKSGLRSPESY